MPYRNRSNVNATIPHPAPAAITIRHGFRLDICSGSYVGRAHRHSRALGSCNLYALSAGGSGTLADRLSAPNSRHETVVKLLCRQNPSLLNRRQLGGRRCTALIDAELVRIATVGSHCAGLVFLRAGVGGRRYALQNRTVLVVSRLSTEASAALGR